MATPLHADGSFERHREAVRERLLEWPQVRPGQDSVSWKINRELVVVAGWGRAILLQLAHPAVAAGVRDHSSFRSSVPARLRRVRSTVRAMLSLTFGDTDQMIEAAAGINSIHDRVRGRVRGGEERTYSAHDPHLQRWVHATLIESIPLTYELLVGPLTTRERDRYCSEATIMEPLLGMPAGWLPRDSAELDAYMREMLGTGTLAVTETSRTIARALLFPRRWHFAWPLFRPLQLFTIGTLPPSIREAYGFEWRPTDTRAFERWTKAIRLLLRVLPRFLHEWPMARQRDLSTGGPWRSAEPKTYSR